MKKIDHRSSRNNLERKNEKMANFFSEGVLAPITGTCVFRIYIKLK